MEGFSVANIPASMAARRSKILARITKGRSNKWIAQNYHHGRELIHEVHTALDPDPSEIYQLYHAIGAPKKITPEVTRRIDQLTAANREMPSEAIARIVSETPGIPKISSVSVDTVRHQLGYTFLPPITAFPLNNDQIENRFMFAGAHNATGWSKTVFTDESSFVLGARGWVWRQRAGTGPEVCWMKGQFPPKVVVFGGISPDYKSALIIAESGTINAESYMDDFGSIWNHSRYEPTIWGA
jgi:transposase